MNWKEIKEGFPKAFSLLNDSKLENRHLLFYGKYNYRDLYDLFDDNNIIIGVYGGSVFDKDRSIKDLKTFDWELLANGIFEESEIGVNTRIEAENAVFTKAFEILENQLTNTK